MNKTLHIDNMRENVHDCAAKSTNSDTYYQIMTFLYRPTRNSVMDSILYPISDHMRELSVKQLENE